MQRELLRTFIIFCLLGGLVAPNAQAKLTATADLVPVAVDGRHIRMDFCEWDECTPLTHPEGYTEEMWKAIEKLCRRKLWTDPAISVFIAGAVIGAFSAGGWVVGIPAGAFGMALAPSLKSDDLAAVSQNYRSLLDTHPLSNYKKSSRELLSLRDGVEMCTHDFETTPAEWLPFCDLSCKKYLARGVPRLEGVELDAISPYDVFFARDEWAKYGAVQDQDRIQDEWKFGTFRNQIQFQGEIK